MLLEYGFKNFFSFKEGMVVSFKLDDKCPKSISHDCDYTNILCVKGANGSGKTNVLKALSMLKDFCKDSFSNKPDAEIDFHPFFESDESSEFYIEFIQDEVFYRYEVVMTNKGVISESLYKKVKKFTLVIKRTGEKISKATEEYNGLKSIKKIRSNASFISTAHQHEIESIEPIYKFFTNIISNVDMFGLWEIQPDQKKISKFYYENPKVFSFVKDMIRRCDIGIDDISIHTRKDEENNDIYFPMFHYLVDGISKHLTYYVQSSGTKALYKQVGLYQIVIEHGGILSLDEFDINLHPHILPLIVRLFMDKEINIKDAQLIFTTHNTEIMDMLGRYRTLLVNKENNESYGYRLDEISGDIIRNDRPISPAYNAGKIGGVPHV